MAPPISDLTDHLGYWIRQLSNHVSHAFSRKLADKDVTVAEWAMMRLMYGREPMPPSRVADEMGMTRGAITKLADRLIVKKLVLREESVRDGRAQTLHLTDQAIAFVPELAALADQNDAECFDHLSDEERRFLKALLVKSIAHLGIFNVPVG